MSIQLTHERGYNTQVRLLSPAPEGFFVRKMHAPNPSDDIADLSRVELEREPDEKAGLLLSFWQTELFVFSGLTIAFALESRKPKPKFFLRVSAATDLVQHFDALDSIQTPGQIHDSARYELGDFRMGTLESLGIGSIRKYAIYG